MGSKRLMYSRKNNFTNNNTMETKNKNEADNNRKQHLQFLEEDLQLLAAEYQEKRNNKSERIRIYRQIKAIIDTMYFFPEMH